MKNRVKKILSIFLVLNLILSLFPDIGFAESTEHFNEKSNLHDYEENFRVIVKYKDNYQYDENNLKKEVKENIVVSSNQLESNNTYILEVTQTEYEAMKRDTNIESIEIDNVFTLLENVTGSNGNSDFCVHENKQDCLTKLCNMPESSDISDFYCNETTIPSTEEIGWNLISTRVAELHEIGITGKGVKVAIFDTGINTNSNDIDLAGGISFVDGSSDYSDDNGHGTKMASVLASNLNNIGLVGFAPDVELYSVKVLDKNGVGKYSAVLNGVEWAIKNNIDIITMSFGSDEYSESIHQAVIKAEQNGILIVASAGNAGKSSLYYPAAFPSVVAVGAYDENYTITKFSNYGDGLDILAPGVNIASYDMNGKSSNTEGTSIAAQEVAGVAALFKSIEQDLNANQLKSLLYGRQTDDLEYSEPTLLDAHIAFDKFKNLEFGIVNNEEFFKNNVFENNILGSGLLRAQETSTSPSVTFSSPEAGKYVSGFNYVSIYVQDNENDTLTCKYYIDNSYTPIGTQTVTGTSIIKLVNFSGALATGSLLDGYHKLRVEVTDGKSPVSIATRVFYVDNSKPVIESVRVVPDGDDCWIYVEAEDIYSGLDSYSAYKIDDYDVSAGWPSTSPFRLNNINEHNSVVRLRIIARDKVGNIASQDVFAYFPPKKPILNVSNIGPFGFELSGLDPTLWHEIKVDDYYVDLDGMTSTTISCNRYDEGSVNIGGLEPGTTYTVSARGKQDGGDEDSFSLFSDEILVTTLNAPPSYSPYVSLKQVESEKISFTWYSVPYATSYIVNVNGIDIESNYTGLTYTLKTIPNNSYSIKIRAKNAFGISNYSNVVSAVSTDLTNVRGRAIDNQLEIVWDEVPGATGYQISVNGVLINYTVDSNSIVEIDNLTGKRIYHYYYNCMGKYNKYYEIMISVRFPSYYSSYGKSFFVYSLPLLVSSSEMNVSNITSNSLDINWNTNPNPNTVQYKVEVFEINNNIPSSIPFKTTDWSYSKTTKLSGLKENTEYAIRIKAKNSQNMEAYSGPLSEKVAKTLRAIPESPINMISTSKDTSITIKWDPVHNANSYRVTRDGVTIATIDKTTFTDQGTLPDSPLNANTEYSYQVYASNESGEGAPSLVMKKRTLPKVPEKPVNVSSTVTKTSISLTWDELSNVTGYEVEFDGKISNASLNNNFTMNGLEPGSFYSYRVRSRNEGGKSEWSELKTIQTIMGTPTIPSNLVLIPYENKIEINWDASMNNTSYIVELNGTEVGSTNEISYEAVNLTSSTIYEIRVKAVNSFEQSDWSTKSVVSTLSEVSGSAKVISTSSEETSVELEWQTVPEAKGYTLKLDDEIIFDNLTTTSVRIGHLLSGHSYSIKIGAIYNDDTIIYNNPTTITTLPTAVKNLSYQAKVIGALVNWPDVEGATGYKIEINGEIKDIGNTNQFFYDQTKSNELSSFKIRAYNQGGYGAWSDNLEIKPFNQYTSTISDIRVDVSSFTALISWENVLDANGEKVYGYEYRLNGQEPMYSSQPLVNIENLVEDTSYSFEVRTIYDEGRIAVSDWSEITNFNTEPKQPQTLVNIVFVTSNDSVDLTWDNVEGVTGYELLIDNSIVPVGMDTHYIDGGLTPLSEHTYQIRVICNGIRGIWSEPKTVFTQEGMPGVPLNIIGMSTRNSVTFKWSPIEGASSYWVKLGETENIISVSTPEITINNLTDATLVSVSVSAVKNDIPSPYSGIVSCSTGIEPPTGVTYVVENGEVVLKWNAVNLATQYEIEVDGYIVGTTTETIYVLQKNENGMAASVRIRAKNDTKAKSTWTELIRVQSAPLELEVQTDENEIFDISLKGNAITDFTNYTFTIEYDKEAIELIDLNSLSESVELCVGNIIETDLIVLSIEQGKIVFKLVTNIQDGKEWSGLINTLKFKSLKAGKTQFKYSVQ